MSSQTSFLPANDTFQPDHRRQEPSVWIRELRIFREWNPNEEVRRITLRRGLNILWARPRELTEPPRLREAGVFGHASGKTTFCRLLRYVLGEQQFSNEDLRGRIREKFRAGWVVGDVRVAGETWLVCRPFAVGPHPFVFRGREMSQLFESPAERLSLEEYRQVLDKVSVHQLPVQSFASREELIEWPHLLQWLTRDQECRYAGLTDFRHHTSESGAPDMDTEDKHFLFRAVLRLIDVQEQTEIEKNKRQLRQRQEAERKAPLLKYQAETGLRRLSDELPEIGVEPGELFLDAVPRILNVKIRGLTNAIEAMQDTPAVRDARQDLFDRQAERQTGEQRCESLRHRIQGVEIELKVLRGEAPPSANERWLAGIVSKQKLCAEPLAKAIEWECPLMSGRLLPVEKKRDEFPIERRIADAEQRLNGLHLELKAAETAVGQLRTKESDARNTLNSAQRDFDRERGKLIEDRSRYRAYVKQAEQTKKDGSEAQQLADSLETFDRQIRQSQDRQAELREQQSRSRAMFSETFDRVMKAVLGSEVDASVVFHGRQMRMKVMHRSDLTSAAIETIKILGFDLAALINSVEGRGDHPRFLLHDGPREADMAADLYQKIFLLARELEESCGIGEPNFQYIITTTESPPESLNRAPWRLVPVLDSSDPEGRLLKIDL